MGYYISATYFCYMIGTNMARKAVMLPANMEVVGEEDLCCGVRL